MKWAFSESKIEMGPVRRRAVTTRCNNGYKSCANWKKIGEGPGERMASPLTDTPIRPTKRVYRTVSRCGRLWVGLGKKYTTGCHKIKFRAYHSRAMMVVSNLTYRMGFSIKALIVA